MKGQKNHPEISQLLRVILDADPLIVAEREAFVMVSGPNDSFTFTKTASGYTVNKTK